MGIALYSGIFLWGLADFDWALIEVSTFAGLAAAYGFGFLWYFSVDSTSMFFGRTIAQLFRNYCD